MGFVSLLHPISGELEMLFLLGFLQMGETIVSLSYRRPDLTQMELMDTFKHPDKPTKRLNRCISYQKMIDDNSKKR